MLKAISIILLWFQNIFGSEVYKAPLCLDSLSIDHSFCSAFIPEMPRIECDLFEEGKNAVLAFGKAIIDEGLELSYDIYDISHDIKNLAYCQYEIEEPCFDCENKKIRHYLFNFEAPTEITVGGVDADFFWGIFFEEKSRPLL